jgi:hypothetical protein
MITQQPPIWHHSNRYSADQACEHCKGIVRHEPWCITCSPTVLYAYEAVVDGDRLTEGDKMILHALGVKWVGQKCAGACQSREIAER